MTTQVPVEIRKFLEKSTKENIDDFQIEIHDGNAKGAGFLGDFFFVSLTNKKTNEVRRLAIKQALPSGTEASMDMISKIFQNETYFYEKVWPEFTTFQKGFSKVKQFRNISKCYAIDATRGAEKISFENLKYQGFRNHDKTEFFEKQQLEYVLRTYGQFHAISMAYRATDPEKFLEITDQMIDTYRMMASKNFFQQAVRQLWKDILSFFDTETNADILEKIKDYMENGKDIFLKIMKYEGSHQAFLQGDCWSNNMMFKYNENGGIEDMRLIDFQLTKLGTVVYDLSYCIYASASQEALDDLEHYLNTYYESLSESLREYDLDPEVIYPFDILKEEWKQYSKFGLIMAMLVICGKHQDTDKLPVLTEIMDKEDAGIANEEYLDDPSRRSEKFKEIARSLVLHAYSNGFL